MGLLDVFSTKQIIIWINGTETPVSVPDNACTVLEGEKFDTIEAFNEVCGFIISCETAIRAGLNERKNDITYMSKANKEDSVQHRKQEDIWQRIKGLSFDTKHYQEGAIIAQNYLENKSRQLKIRDTILNELILLNEKIRQVKEGSV